MPLGFAGLQVLGQKNKILDTLNGFDQHLMVVLD